MKAESEPKPVSVEFSVRLSDRSYESTLAVPLGSPEPQWRPVVEAWLLLMQAALRPMAASEEGKK